MGKYEETSFDKIVPQNLTFVIMTLDWILSELLKLTTGDFYKFSFADDGIFSRIKITNNESTNTCADDGGDQT